MSPTAISQFTSLRIAGEKQEPLKRQYSISGDVLAYRRCRRQYGMYKVRCYRPSKTIQFYFGTVIHQTLDLAHEHYLGRLDPSLRHLSRLGESFHLAVHIVNPLSTS